MDGGCQHAWRLILLSNAAAGMTIPMQRIPTLITCCNSKPCTTSKSVARPISHCRFGSDTTGRLRRELIHFTLPLLAPGSARGDGQKFIYKSLKHQQSSDKGATGSLPTSAKAIRKPRTTLCKQSDQNTGRQATSNTHQSNYHSELKEFFHGIIR